MKKKISKFKAKVKSMVRSHHLFAKTREKKQRISKAIYKMVSEIQQSLQRAFKKGRRVRAKSSRELEELKEVMQKLLPQILHFLETGFVARGKIIHLQMSKLYSIVRGKAGRRVEFGLKWGISRMEGFVLGFLINQGQHCSDKKFCREALKEHKAIFSFPPDTYGFDRGGFSQGNIRKAKKEGVKNIGIAPTGKTKWAVGSTMKDFIRRERAQVEGCIGVAKSSRYGFNKPNVRSTEAMISRGHRAFLGMNLMKLLRETTNMQMAAAQ